MAFIPASSIIYRSHEDNNHFPTSSPCAPQDFNGVPDFLMRRSMSFSGMERGEEFQADDDVSDDGSQMLGEKKRRLNMEQVRALEKSFESGNKLEPERKTQLARALGLQPRQIAIWFQNRRARWKTKQLERDYDVLKRQFEALKSDNDALKSQNKKLQTQLLALKTRESTGSGPINLNKDNNEGSNWSNGSENSCEVNLNTTSTDNSTLVYPQSHQNINRNAVVLPPATATTHLIHSSSRPDHVQTCQKFERTPVSSDQCFSNVMFGGVEENPEFWPWTEQQYFQ